MSDFLVAPQSTETAFNEFILGLRARESLERMRPSERNGTSAVTGFIEANYAGDRCLLL